MTQIDRILARHQLTNGTGTVIAYQVENEYYNGSAAGRAYMQHLEDKARADGITVPLTGNNNGTFNSGVGALDVDGPDSYPQGFNCSNPTQWNGVPDISYDHPAGKPLYTPEFQGGAFDPWGGPGYDKCAQLINDQFANVFYKQNIAVGATAQSFYMTYGGTNWGWLGDAGELHVLRLRRGDPRDAPARPEVRRGQADRLLHAVGRAADQDRPDQRGAAGQPAIVDTARMNPDTGTQFHVLRHSNSTSTSVDTTHISIDFNAQPVGTSATPTTTRTRRCSTPAQLVARRPTRATPAATTRTPSRSPTRPATALTVPFTGTAVRWIGSQTNNHGYADVYLDGTKQATVD